MEITLERIREGYENLLKNRDYRNYYRNRDLNDGNSTRVFYNDVLQRVNLQYMGLVDDFGYVGITSIVNGQLVQFADKIKFANLIVGDGLLKASTEVYKELAADKSPILSLENDYLKDFDFKELVEENIKEMSFGGGTLLKGIKDDKNKVTIHTVPRNQFFEIYNEVNTKKIDAYVVFTYQENIYEEKTDILNVEIYTEGRTQYRKYKLDGGELTEIVFGESEVIEDVSYEGWQVGYIKCISDFDDDVVSNIREIVVNDTLTSQAFDKVANPLLQVPDDLIEYDEKNQGTVNVKDRIIPISENAKDIKQISLETKVADWEIQRKAILKKIYISMGINENILGVSESSMGDMSGEAMKKSFQRTISRVNTKRNKVYTALETVLNWGYSYAKLGNLDIEIKGKDIIELSESEMLANQKVKIENLNALATVENETLMAKYVQEQKDELLKDIIGG